MSDSIPLRDVSMARVAEAAGFADSSALQRCMHSEKVQQTIVSDSLLSARINLAGAPTAMIDGRVLSRPASISERRSVAEGQAKRK